MKIAVMAGTPIDTKMGSELLKKYNFIDLIEIPISQNPIEQTTFQARSKKEKESVLEFYIEKIKNDNCTTLFVYCNSLSSAVDFDFLAEKYEINIITPMQMYRKLALDYKILTVMAANSHGLVGVENNLYIANPNLKVFGLSMLELVKVIENKEDAKKIVADFNFVSLLDYAESIGSEALVLGCTHFPYIKEELSEITNLKIIDIGLFMIKKLKEIVGQK